MALSLVFTKRFKKDAKKAQRRGKDLAKTRAAICALQSEEPLAASLRDHALSGDWADHRELHLEPDWPPSRAFREAKRGLIGATMLA